MDELNLFRKKCITVIVSVIVFWVITDWMYKYNIVNYPFLGYRPHMAGAYHIVLDEELR